MENIRKKMNKNEEITNKLEIKLSEFDKKTNDFKKLFEEISVLREEILVLLKTAEDIGIITPEMKKTILKIKV